MTESTIPTPPVVLASQSPGRRALLARLFPHASALSTDIDETPRPGERGAALAARLAADKALAAATRLRNDGSEAIVIGADQVAECGRRRLDKPLTPTRNIDMLMACSGRDACFYSAVCVLDMRDDRRLEHVDLTRVRFSTLDREHVSRYVARDEPWHCAGGFKVEASGISLFTRIRSDDPTGLVGLPLIFVTQALRELGVAL